MFCAHHNCTGAYAKCCMIARCLAYPPSSSEYLHKHAFIKYFRNALENNESVNLRAPER